MKIAPLLCAIASFACRTPLGQIAAQVNSNAAYDIAGNLKSGDGASYACDYANRLKSVSGSGLSGALTYDPASRLQAVSGGEITLRPETNFTLRPRQRPGMTAQWILKLLRGI